MPIITIFTSGTNAHGRRLPPEQLPATGWHRMDIAGLWPTVLLPLLEASPALQAELELAMARWHEHCHNRQPDTPWRFNDPEAPAPYMISQDESAAQKVMYRIHDAAERFDPAAMACCALSTLLMSQADLDLPEGVMTLLWDRHDAIERTFQPQRHEAKHWRPDASCHWFIDFELALAKAWRPDIDWRIVQSSHHSTVVALNERLIFDLVLLQDRDDPDDTENEPILYVRGEGQAMASIRECRRRHRNGQARWKRKQRREAAKAEAPSQIRNNEDN
jgi:hypothetical protein